MYVYILIPQLCSQGVCDYKALPYGLYINLKEDRLKDRVLAFMQSTVNSHKDNRLNSSNSGWTACKPS